MNWFFTFLKSKNGQKVVMSLTGLFLTSFLLIHLIGNLQLIKEDKGEAFNTCLLYTSDAADERSSVDLGGRRIIKKKKTGHVIRSNILNEKQYKNTKQ